MQLLYFFCQDDALIISAFVLSTITMIVLGSGYPGCTCVVDCVVLRGEG